MKKYSLLITAIMALLLMAGAGFSVAMADAESATPAVAPNLPENAEQAEPAPQQSDDASVEPASTEPVAAEDEGDSGEPEIGQMDISTLEGKVLGVPQGTVQDVHIEKTYPKLTLQRHNFEADMMLALERGMCDACVMDDVICYALARKKPIIKLYEDENLPINYMGMAFTKNEKGEELSREFNKFLGELKESGELEEICTKWIHHFETAEMPQLDIPTEGEPIVVGMEPCTEPIVFMRNNEIVGLDAELVYRFAAYIKRPIRIENIDYYGLLTAVAAAKIDIAASGFLITEDRRKSVIFSDYYYESKSIIAVRDGAAVDPYEGMNFFQRLAVSFERNIIEEERYMLIWDGLVATFLIAFFSVLFGTIVGAAVCYLRMSHNKALQWVARIYIDVMRGMPILVLLMLMYYVAFAGSSVEAIYVAIITFSLNFGAYVSEMFRTAISSVDRGQSEAGIAMGFSPFQSFFYIVLPQAVRRVLPVYKGEVISLIKNTSVVGYIAIEDLTKMTDLIRARTFEPFFPLIMVALLYFLIAWLFALAMDCLGNKINSEKNSKR